MRMCVNEVQILKMSSLSEERTSCYGKIAELKWPLETYRSSRCVAIPHLSAMHFPSKKSKTE